MPSRMDWHHRFTQRARWTCEGCAAISSFRLKDPGSRILEVGCGTGAVLLGLSWPAGHCCQVFGLDLKGDYALARHNSAGVHRRLQTDLDLPFPGRFST